MEEETRVAAKMAAEADSADSNLLDYDSGYEQDGSLNITQRPISDVRNADEISRPRDPSVIFHVSRR